MSVREGTTVGDETTLDTLIAVYMVPDLAREDFDALTGLIGDGAVSSEGVVLVSKDTEGKIEVVETGDHAGRKGAKLGAGAGLALGLFAPPVLAATAVGAAAGGLVGTFAKTRVSSGLGETMDEALPPGSAGVIAIYDHADAARVDEVLANAIMKSAAQIDKASAKELKAGLAEAQEGLGG